MRHIMLTRCNFSDDDLFMKYFEVMKKHFIPSIKNQTCKKFKLFITTNNKDHPHHKDLIRKEFEDSGIDLDLGIKGFKQFVVEKKYNIQSRHDCDDYMAPNYIEKIQQLYNEKVESHDEFLIHAQPVKLDHNTDDEYMGMKYSDKAPSMFLSLCQKHPNKNILQAMHGQFSALVPTVFSMGTGYVKLVIHDNNKLSVIKKGDVKIQK